MSTKEESRDSGRPVWRKPTVAPLGGLPEARGLCKTGASAGNWCQSGATQSVQCLVGSSASQVHCRNGSGATATCGSGGGGPPSA